MNDFSPLKKPRRRSVVAVSAAVVVTAGLIFGATAAANASTVVGTTPSTTATPSPTHSAGAHARAGELRKELRVILHNGKNLGDEAQAVAVVIVDNHPKLYAKLPSSLKTDLTSLKNAAEPDRTSKATSIEKAALSGGYGPKIEALAKRVQSHLSGSKSTSAPNHTSGS